MQADPVLDLLRETTPRILEQVAFVFADVTDEAEPFPGDVLEADIEFNGPMIGTLRLTTSAACAANLAASLLGVEADDPAIDKYVSDVLGETLQETLPRIRHTPECAKFVVKLVRFIHGSEA